MPNPVQTIRDRYTLISTHLGRYQRVAQRIGGSGAEGAVLVAYFDAGALRKIESLYTYGRDLETQGYYFWNDSLFFVLQSRRKVSTDSGAQPASETRLYYADGKLIRLVDMRGRQRDVTDAPAESMGEETHRTAAELRDRARELFVRAASGSQSAGSPEGLTASQRAEMAADHQRSLRTIGCPACKVWVGGNENTILHILDPEAATGVNFYREPPVAWYNAGFERVIYYSKPGVIFVSHVREAADRP